MKQTAAIIKAGIPVSPVDALLPFFFFLGPQLQHMEVPGLGVKSELQLPAFPTATVTPDP